MFASHSTVALINWVCCWFQIMSVCHMEMEIYKNSRERGGGGRVSVEFNEWTTLFDWKTHGFFFMLFLLVIIIFSSHFRTYWNWIQFLQFDSCVWHWLQCVVGWWTSVLVLKKNSIWSTFNFLAGKNQMHFFLSHNINNNNSNLLFNMFFFSVL